MATNKIVRFNWVNELPTFDNKYEGQFFYAKNDTLLGEELKITGLYYCTSTDYILLSMDYNNISLKKEFLKYVVIVEDETNPNKHYMSFRSGITQLKDAEGNPIEGEYVPTESPDDAIEITRVDVSEFYKHITIEVEDDTEEMSEDNDEYMPLATIKQYTINRDEYGHVTSIETTSANNRYKWKEI